MEEGHHRAARIMSSVLLEILSEPRVMLSAQIIRLKFQENG